MNTFPREIRTARPRGPATAVAVAGVLTVALGAIGLADGLLAEPVELVAPASPIDSLDQAALQETFRLLRTNHVERDALTLEMLNRAALEGLLKRLDFGAELVPLAPGPGGVGPVAEPAQPVEPVAKPVIAESVAPGIAYVRPTVFTLEAVPAFDEALEAVLKAAVSKEAETTLVLDLRTPGPPAEFAVAAQLLGRFVPADQPLFSVAKPEDPAPRQFRSTGPPRWTGRLMVLIDKDATNVGETMAAVLRRLVRAPLVGTATEGHTMQYETAPLSPTHALRFASAEMRLPDGSSLFRKGLAPDLTVAGTAADKTAVFERQAREGVRPFISNPERPHHNEAALVAGTAPELPYRIARGAGTPTPFDTPPLQDRPLQVVVDVLVARRVLH